MRRIAWRLQANAEGDLSERARQRALLVAEDADLRIRAPQSFLKELAQGNRDPRLPAARDPVDPRSSKGKPSRWKCWRKGFAIEEQVYRSLSAVARHVTGVQWNGFAFFNLRQRSHVMGRERKPIGSGAGTARVKHVALRDLHQKIDGRGTHAGVQYTGSPDENPPRLTSRANFTRDGRP